MIPLTSRVSSVKYGPEHSHLSIANELESRHEKGFKTPCVRVIHDYLGKEAETSVKHKLKWKQHTTNSEINSILFILV